MYFADGDNGVVRKVTVSTGIITKIAGSGDASGTDGDGGQATYALSNLIIGIALDISGEDVYSCILHLPLTSLF